MMRKRRDLDFDPRWAAPTGDTQRFVLVLPAERTCLRCGDTFAAGTYCIRCGDDTSAPNVATDSYLIPDEYVTVRL